MANTRTKRLRPVVLQEDIDAFAALQAISSYNPSNSAFEAALVTAARDLMQTKQTDEVQKQAAADAARDASVAAEWEFHDMMIGVKNQIKAQFGESSDELQALGLKKKSEYKRGGRKASIEVSPV